MPGRRRRERLERVAEAAARQSGRAPLGRLRGLLPFDEVTTEIPSGEGFLIDPRGDAPLTSAMCTGGRAGRARRRWSSVPTPGFSEGEVGRARARRPVGRAPGPRRPAGRDRRDRRRDHRRRGRLGGRACLTTACSAASSPARSRPTWSRRDDDFLAFRDIAPKAPVHLLVIPARHVDSIAGVARAGRARARGHAALHRRGGARGRPGRGVGYRVTTNHGPDARQSVFHLHWHVMGGGATIREHVSAAGAARARGAGHRAGRPRVGGAGGRAGQRAARPGGAPRPGDLPARQPADAHRPGAARARGRRGRRPARRAGARRPAARARHRETWSPTRWRAPSRSGRCWTTSCGATARLAVTPRTAGQKRYVDAIRATRSPSASARPAPARPTWPWRSPRPR